MLLLWILVVWISEPIFTQSLHTTWCHPCEAGVWLLPNFKIGTHIHSLWLSGWGDSGPYRTVVETEQLALSWPPGSSSTVPLSSCLISSVSYWCYTVQGMLISSCVPLNHRLSCNLSRRYTGWSSCSSRLYRFWGLPRPVPANLQLHLTTAALTMAHQNMAYSDATPPTALMVEALLEVVVENLMGSSTRCSQQTLSQTRLSMSDSDLKGRTIQWSADQPDSFSSSPGHHLCSTNCQPMGSPARRPVLSHCSHCSITV